TGKRPGRRLLKVCVLRSIVSCNRADIGHVPHKSLARVIICEHSIAIALCEPSNVRIDSRECGGRNLLDLITNECIASDNVEVLPIQAKSLPHEVRQLLNLGVVLSTDNGINVQSQS